MRSLLWALRPPTPPPPNPPKGPYVEIPDSGLRVFASHLGASAEVLRGSGDLVSKVISPLIGVISNYKYSYLIYNPSY